MPASVAKSLSEKNVSEYHRKAEGCWLCLNPVLGPPIRQFLLPPNCRTLPKIYRGLPQR
jgi:hypothetical protein